MLKVPHLGFVCELTPLPLLVRIRRALRRPRRTGLSRCLTAASYISLIRRRLPLPGFPRSRRDGWIALAVLEVFIFVFEVEWKDPDQARAGVHRRRCKPDPVRRRRMIGLIRMLTFGAYIDALPRSGNGPALTDATEGVYPPE